MSPMNSQQQFHNILVLANSRTLFAQQPLNRSLDRITRLAMEHGAALTFCDVIESPPEESAEKEITRRLIGLRRRFAHDYLTTLSAPVRELVPLGVEVWSGTPFLVVTRQVIENGYDLVVHLTDRGGRESGLDADDMHLIRKCPCPVWIIDEHRDAPYRNIAVAVDRDIFESDGAASSFAAQMSQSALMLARLEGARVHIVHAWQPFGADMLDDPELGVEQETVQEYVDGQRQNHATWLRALQETLQAADGRDPEVAPVEAHLVDGAPERTIPQFVEGLDADLLIMGTVGVTTVQGMFIGNTAERILRDIKLPVLALKPPGFSSPIQPEPAEHADENQALEADA